MRYYKILTYTFAVLLSVMCAGTLFNLGAKVRQVSQRAADAGADSLNVLHGGGRSAGREATTAEQRIRGIIGEVEEQVGKNAAMRDAYVEAFGGLQRALGRRSIESDDKSMTVLHLLNGQYTFYDMQGRPADVAGRVDSLSRWCEAHGTRFIYFNRPSKVMKGTLPYGLHDVLNCSADSLVAELRQRGTFMRVSRLTDSGLNMVVGRITAPDDWQVSEQVQWSSYGNYPGMTQLSAVSPDGQRSFQLISTMSYYQTDSIFNSLGENETDPTTYRIHRQYRTAEQFVEMMLSGIGCTGAQKLSSSSIDSQSLSALKSTAEQHAYQTGYSLVQSLANLGMSANLVGYESTVVDNRYAVTTQSGQTEYIEVFTLVWAYQTSWVVQNSSISLSCPTPAFRKAASRWSVPSNPGIPPAPAILSSRV